MPIYNIDEKEIVRILDNQGREIETVYDQNGVIVYTNASEMVGNTPMYLKCKAKPLKDYRIYGETIQDGTPSPDMPVDVAGCGVRTENLLNQDADGWERAYSVTQDGNTTYNGFFDASPYIEILPEKVYTLVDRNSGSGVYNAFYDTDKNFISSFGAYGQMLYTATSPPNAKYIRCSVMSLSRYPDGARRAMLIEGDTEPPAYIPYGYKIPVTVSNGTDTVATPVYIGAEPLHRIGDYADYVDYASGKIVRRNKKLVLTGEEAWNRDAETGVFVMDISNSLFTGDFQSGISSHWPFEKNKGVFGLLTEGHGCIRSAYNQLWIRDNNFPSVADFKSYLAAQYAAGTPVTVWYVLTTPIEEPLGTLPAIPTLSGTNAMSVDTTVKPSQMYIKGKIKPDGYGRLVDKNGTYILDKNGVQLTVHGQTDTPNT